MKNNKSYTLYRLTIPNLGYYIGSTSQILRKRIIAHKSKLRKNIHNNSNLQEWYNKGGNLDNITWEIIEEGNKYQIKKGEWEYIKLEDEKCLNIKKPYSPKYLKILIKEGNPKVSKIYERENMRKKNKTPLGKATYMLYTAKQNVKKFSKQKRWGMVEIWKERVKERQIVKDSLD